MQPAHSTTQPSPREKGAETPPHPMEEEFRDMVQRCRAPVLLGLAPHHSWNFLQPRTGAVAGAGWFPGCSKLWSRAGLQASQIWGWCVCLAGGERRGEHTHCCSSRITAWLTGKNKNMISPLTVLNDKSLTGKAAHWGKHHQSDCFSFPRDCWPREEGEEGVFEMLVRCSIMLFSPFLQERLVKHFSWSLATFKWKEKAQVIVWKILCLSLLNSVTAELEVQMVSFSFFPKLKPAKLRVQRSVFSHCTC